MRTAFSLSPSLSVAVSLLVLAAVATPGCVCSPSSSGPAAKTEDAGAPGASASLLGGERGLDHIGIAVKDLDLATHTYHDILGFNRPSAGKLPNGIQNVNYYFSDATYIETLVYWDREKAAWLADFTDKHTGALFAVLSAMSPEGTTDFLAARGITVGAPHSGTIQVAGQDAMPDEQWKTFFLPQGLLPGDPLYFISYKRAARDEFLHKLEDPRARRMLYHKNTALGVRAVWFAVSDLAAATRSYESIGLVRGRTFKDAALGATGQVFAAGEGEIWLLSPIADDGVLAAFLKERGGPGIVGITLEAGSLKQAASVIGERTGIELPTFEGQMGASFRVPPDLTQGVWLEFAQSRR